MPSETDLLNDSLSQIGANRITGIDDGSVNANHCLTLYPSLRKALLRSHHWNFAEHRAELAQNVTPPLFEFSFSYTLPSDSLKVKEYNGSSLDTTNLTLFDVLERFKIEGRNLFTNDGEVKIVYIQDITDPNVWDPLFYQVLASWLASKLAMAITKNVEMSRSLLEDAVNILLPFAVAVDGQEGTITPFRSDDLIMGR